MAFEGVLADSNAGFATGDLGDVRRVGDLPAVGVHKDVVAVAEVEKVSRHPVLRLASFEGKRPARGERFQYAKARNKSMLGRRA